MNLKKKKETVANMIGHFERNYNKRKEIFLGISRNSGTEQLVGVAEMSDYVRAVNMITIGFRLNKRFCGRGIATEAVKVMTDCLFYEFGINRIQAFVMPENMKSQNVLKRNGYITKGTIRQGQIWIGKGIVDLILFSRLRIDLRYPIWDK